MAWYIFSVSLIIIYFSYRYAWWKRSIDYRYPRILMYHMIRDAIPGKKFNSLRVSPENFEMQIANNYKLDQNFPNPFNPTTTIEYNIVKSGNYSLEIYNALGQKIRTLYTGELKSGKKTAVWNSLNDKGKSVSSGVYFYKLQGDNVNIIRKMILMR